MIESADKLAALGDKIDALTRFNAYFTHANSYYAAISDPAAGPTWPKDAAQAKAAQDAAASALKTLAAVKNPEHGTAALRHAPDSYLHLSSHHLPPPAPL